MEIQFQNLGPDEWKAEAALAFCFENESIVEISPDLDKACPWLAIAPALRDFKGKKGELAVLYGHPDLKIPRIILAGLGKAADFSLKESRIAIAGMALKCRELGIQTMLLPASLLERFPGGLERLLEESVYAALISLYRFTELKTDVSTLPVNPRWLAIGLDSKNRSDALQAAVRRGEMAAWAVELGRNLDNLPGNLLYPEAFALRAAALGHEWGLTCSIMADSALDEAHMGCLLAVGRGSCHPPRLIVLEYAPPERKEDKPLVLVGKGITFDSGGICLKPAANMLQMKCDMSGAAAVLAVLAAASREKVDRRLVGILACAENLPGGHAFRPGDVLNSASGDTVEVINTDAEGRLALCDALSHALGQWQPEAIIDIATLTGACAVALGTDLAGLFSNDDSLAAKIEAYGSITGENFWRMPLWGPYKKQLESNVADIKHTGSREGGAIIAALFLENFIKTNVSWAHLDIAGVDWASKSTPLCPEGPTGFGIRVLLELCRGGLA